MEILEILAKLATIMAGILGAIVALMKLRDRSKRDRPDSPQSLESNEAQTPSVSPSIVLSSEPPSDELVELEYRRLKAEAEAKRLAAKRLRKERETQSAVLIPKTFSNSLGMKFKLIPAGTFTMGSPGSEEGRSSDERQHKVTLSRPYYMGVYEVTQGEWKRVMGKRISAQAQKGTYSSKLCGEGDRHPMYYVSWEDCQKFVDKLNAQYKKELEQKLGPGWRYRLPTEAEWEYACRGGTTGPYGGTGDLDTMGWYRDNSGLTTHAVGGKQPNGYGLYDMHGNVWEWCSDWYGDYPSGSVTDPPGVSSGSYRVCRGGSWYYDAANCRSAHRSIYAPAYRLNSLGVRLSISSR